MTTASGKDRRVSPAVGEFAIGECARLRESLIAIDAKIGQFAGAEPHPEMPMLSIIGDVARAVKVAIATVLDAEDAARMAAGFGEALVLTAKAVHDDKEDGRPDRFVTTEPGDLDTAGRPMRAGT